MVNLIDSLLFPMRSIYVTDVRCYVSYCLSWPNRTRNFLGRTSAHISESEIQIRCRDPVSLKEVIEKTSTLSFGNGPVPSRVMSCEVRPEAALTMYIRCERDAVQAGHEIQAL